MVYVRDETVLLWSFVGVIESGVYQRSLLYLMSTDYLNIIK